MWGCGVWVRDYCSAGCAWWAGGEAEFETSVAHSHPLPMIPEEVPHLCLALYHLIYLIALLKNLCGLLLD